MIEILAGEGFCEAVKALGITAEKKHEDERYEVWEVDQAGFDRLCGISDDDWKESWGWWRHCTGSNISDYPTHKFVVNGKKMVGYFDLYRLKNFLEDQKEEAKEDRLTKKDYFDMPYRSLTEYLEHQFGASTEKNVCAIAVDLAKLNGVSMAELFDRYQTK